jgi:hypothetical protein
LKGNEFLDIKKEEMFFNQEAVDKLWKISLELCNDEPTFRISEYLHKKAV